MIVTVASGKGGTEKTSVAVNRAVCLEKVHFVDCDVEEPNAHLLLHPKISRIQPVYVLVPVVNEDLCDYCGKCAEFCQYNALFVGEEKVVFFPEYCSSCGGCSLVCPRQVITEEQRRLGRLKFGATENLEIVYGELDVGEHMAVPVITEAKRHIKTDKKSDFGFPAWNILSGHRDCERKRFLCSSDRAYALRSTRFEDNS